MTQYGTYVPVNSSGNQICCITMNKTDLLRLLACPPDITSLMRQTILQSWGNIQNECSYHGSHEFKLEGYPWAGQGNDAVTSRRLLTGILRVMAQQGWNLLQATDTSKKESDKDSLFFDRGVPEADVSLIALSFNMSDRIRIVDAPGFLPYLKDAVQKSWPKGIQNEREYNGSLELKLRGNPWFSNGEEAVYSKLLLCQIIANFRTAGYKLYASVDISAAGGRDWSGGDLDSWVFRRVSENWK
ncbi:unnamed protein product [Orchesella dallaii]|uniref:Uncharacterized protein n=1 Tax=Orchesella dallaii TaxID=48710 RepID=A0ABP1QNX1_9HEXA